MVLSRGAGGILSTIAIFSALCFPSMGGVERFTESLASELVRQGHEVIVVTNDTHHAGVHEISSSGFEVFRLPCWDVLGGRYPVPIHNADYRFVMRELAARQLDGVLVNTRFYLHSLLGVRIARRHGLRAVVLDHGSAYLTLGSPVLDWVIARYEDAITSYLRRQPVDFYGISQKSVEWLAHFAVKACGIINNSIDAAAYRAQASSRSFRSELGIGDELMLAFTGRFIPEKGIATLVDMMQQLQGERVHLVMAGDGPLRSAIEDAKLEAVHIVGRLDAPDIAALLLESDLFCLPTRSEGFSTSLLEATACGTSSLVTDVGGARELMPDDSYGFVMHEADACAFASIVHRVLQGRYDVSSKGDRCRRRAEECCSWDASARQLLKAMQLDSR